MACHGAVMMTFCHGLTSQRRKKKIKGHMVTISYNNHIFFVGLVCHAEYNAFINKGDKDIDGSILYTGLFPCKDCAKLIVQSGVTEVIYMSHKYKDKPKYQIAEDILNKANVKFRLVIQNNINA